LTSGGPDERVYAVDIPSYKDSQLPGPYWSHFPVNANLDSFDCTQGDFSEGLTPRRVDYSARRSLKVSLYIEFVVIGLY